jgi:hypothetical protein
MTWGFRFAVVFGLVAFLAMSAPASATTFTYDLKGDTSTGYAEPAFPGSTRIDLADADTGSTSFPGHTLRINDIIDVAVILNNPISFNWANVIVQDSDGKPFIFYDSTYSYALGGVPVPAPSSSNWDNGIGSYGALVFGGGFSDPSGTFSFDQLIVHAVITSLVNPSGQDVTSLAMTAGRPYLEFYNPPVATTPLPGGLLLMMTALGGLGIVARRKRATAA